MSASELCVGRDFLPVTPEILRITAASKVMKPIGYTY